MRESLDSLVPHHLQAAGVHVKQIILGGGSYELPYGVLYLDFLQKFWYINHTYTCGGGGG